MTTPEDHHPRAGSPIICATTRRMLGHWTDRAPTILGGYRFEFAPRPPVPALFGDADIDAMMKTVKRFSFWLVFGSPSDAVQVWATNAEQPEDLIGLSWFSPERPEGDEGKTVEDFLKLRVAGVIDPRERSYLEGFARSRRQMRGG